MFLLSLDSKKCDWIEGKRAEQHNHEIPWKVPFGAAVDCHEPRDCNGQAFLFSIEELSIEELSILLQSTPTSVSVP